MSSQLMYLLLKMSSAVLGIWCFIIMYFAGFGLIFSDKNILSKTGLIFPGADVLIGIVLWLLCGALAWKFRHYLI